MSMKALSSFDFPRAAWRKSAVSSANGSCVEVARLTATSVGARDSKEGTGGPVLQFSPPEWSAFFNQLKAGRYDLS
jgi:ABC-type amino acid transport substrate-binding protein